MEFHPLVHLFPALEGEAFNALAEDIKENGLVEPILLYEGKIIDGRNRYNACQAVGVEPDYREWNGDGISALVQSLNIHRRHLTGSQRAVIALDLLPKIKAEAKERQRQSGEHFGRGMEKVSPVPVEPIEAVHVAARLVGVGKTIVQEAKRIQDHAPALLDDVRAGRKSIDTVGQQLGKTGRGGRLTTHAPDEGRWKCPICLGRGWVNRDPGYTPFEA